MVNISTVTYSDRDLVILPECTYSFVKIASGTRTKLLEMITLEWVINISAKLHFWHKRYVGRTKLLLFRY